MKRILNSLSFLLIASGCFVSSYLSAQVERDGHTDYDSPDGRWRLSTGKVMVGTGFARLTNRKSGKEVPDFEKKAWAYVSNESGVKADSGWFSFEAWKPGVLLFSVSSSEHDNVAEKNLGWSASYRLADHTFFETGEQKKSNREGLLADLYKTIPSPKGDFSILVFKNSETDWVVPTKEGARGYLPLGGLGMGVGAEGSACDFSLSPDGQWFLGTLRMDGERNHARLAKRKSAEGLDFEMVGDFEDKAWAFFTEKTGHASGANDFKLQILGWKPGAARLGFTHGEGKGLATWTAAYRLEEQKFIVPADVKNANASFMETLQSHEKLTPPSAQELNSGTAGKVIQTTIPTTTSPSASTIPPPTPFTTILRAHWKDWAGESGAITPDRLDYLMKKREIHGDEAAVLATLKYLEAVPKSATANFQSSVEALKGKEPAKLMTVTMKQIEEYEALVAQHPNKNRYDTAFKKMQTSIQADPHTLYAEGAPHMNSIHQSRNGDCWLLSTIIGMIHRNPGDVRKLITDDGDGDAKYSVHFAYHTFKVKAPTDAEIGAYSADKSDGDWLYVLEDAMGQYREDFNHLHHVKEANDDALVGGGGPLAFHDILGHNSDHVSITPQNPKKDLVRQTLTQAFEHRHLVTIGTPNDEKVPLPRGIAHAHVLAIIGWDAAKDEVTIRNPIGANIEPKGTGPLDGYQTVDGVFTLSLTDFSKYFVNIDVENDKPYKPDQPKKK